MSFSIESNNPKYRTIPYSQEIEVSLRSPSAHMPHCANCIVQIMQNTRLAEEAVSSSMWPQQTIKSIASCSVGYQKTSIISLVPSIRPPNVVLSSRLFGGGMHWRLPPTILPISDCALRTHCYCGRPHTYRHHRSKHFAGEIWNCNLNNKRS